MIQHLTAQIMASLAMFVSELGPMVSLQSARSVDEFIEGQVDKRVQYARMVSDGCSLSNGHSLRVWQG